MDRESWSAERWKTWQEERLQQILYRAAKDVPFYREQWSARRRHGDRSSPEYLENWPILEKEWLRENPRAFIADDCDPRRMLHIQTSGSTGTPLNLWWSRETAQRWYALFEARWRSWYGVTRHDRWANIGGRMVIPAIVRRPPFWVWNPALRQLYMSSYHLAPDLIPSYVDALTRYRIVYLWGFTSSLHAVARIVLERGLDVPRWTVAIANAEPVLEHQRETIERAFDCPLRETYGQAEIVAAASECEHRRIHVWPESGWIEIVEDGSPAAPGVPGDLVCTGLSNPDMPLIRYRVGDRAMLPATPEACPCGRTLPLISEIEGRIGDTLYTRDGRRIGRMINVLNGLQIQEAQIVQLALDRLEIRYVAAPENDTDSRVELVRRVRERMGDIAIDLVPLPEIPRGPNGKLRMTICRLPAEEKALIGAA